MQDVLRDVQLLLWGQIVQVSEQTAHRHCCAAQIGLGRGELRCTGELRKIGAQIGEMEELIGVHRKAKNGPAKGCQL